MKTTNLLLDLSWSEANAASMMAKQESIEIEHYDFELTADFKMKHRVMPSTSTEFDRLVQFLTDNNIDFKINDRFVTLTLAARMFLCPNHHIELRAT